MSEGDVVNDLVTIDGSMGEGGGQILRTALSLSLVTGRPFRIQNLRGGRPEPGLRPQHLACLRGVEAIAPDSKIEGATVGSRELSFEPGKVSAGSYILDVGTAGSTTLVFQALYYPLALSGGGELRLRGGTHVMRSPSYHYLAWVWLPAAEAFGLRCELHLRHAGFYPEGDGEFRAKIPPRAEPPVLVDLPARGTLVEMDVTSFVGGQSFELAEKQGMSASNALREKGIYCSMEKIPLPVTRSAGSAVFIRAHFEHTVAGFTALGEKAAPPDRVGQEAAELVADFMESGGALDENLSDQILVPAALLAAGRLGPSSPGTTRFTTANVTPHLTTQAAVLELFLPVEIEIEPSGMVTVAPDPTARQ